MSNYQMDADLWTSGTNDMDPLGVSTVHGPQFKKPCHKMPLAILHEQLLTMNNIFIYAHWGSC